MHWDKSVVGLRLSGLRRAPVLLLACVVLATFATGSAAWADCTPAAANNVTANCSGTTIDQGDGAPGSSVNPQGNGYGTGTETGVTVNVLTNSTLTGSQTAINLGDGTVVTNNSGATISGNGGFAIATNGSVNVTNSGNISGFGGSGIFARGSATVTNNVGATIVGATNAIESDSGFVHLINFGSVTSSGGIGVGINSSGNVTVTNNAGAAITGGVYGIFAQLGGSSVFNAGTISGGNDAIIFSGAGNTLTLAPGSVITGNVAGFASNTFQLGGTGTASFDVSQIGSAAQYQGFGTFNKIDSSTWTLTGANAALAWTVQQGTLNVAGSVGAVTVTGGTLMGTGITSAVTANTGGIFAPGSGTPGSSMTVSGTLGFDAASTYAVNINPATSSFASVSGVTTLGGATVNAIFASGSYVAKQYMILNATGGFGGGGTFGSVINTNLPSGFKDTLSYDPTHAYLNLALAFTAPPGSGLSGNQQSVGNALVNYFNSNGGIPIVYGGLTGPTLTQASGETATGSQQTTFNAMTQFMGMMTDPFMAGRNDGAGTGGPATGYADEANPYGSMANAKRNPNDALAAIYSKGPPRVTPFEARWSTWVSGFGGSQTTDGNAGAGSSSTTSSIYGTAVGADYRFSPFTIAGFSLAGGGTNFSVANGGSGRSELFQAGAFVRHDRGAAYITAALAYGWQDITTNRTVTIAGFDQLRARFNANTYSGRVEGGYRYVVPVIGGIGITPYAAGQFTTFNSPGYAEQVLAGANTFALAYGARSITDPRSELGLRADKSFVTDMAILTLRARAAWSHDFNPGSAIAATFQALPGATFVVNGTAQARDAALTTASAEVKWNSHLSTAAIFEGEFSNVTRSYAGKGVVRYEW